MKNRITLLVFFGLLSFVLSSYRPGAAHDGNTDATGSDGNTAGCSGSGCHTNNPTTSLGTILEFDSAGVAVSRYYPGMPYTVTITATNATGLTLSKFGFQMACVTNASAGTSTTVQAGTWGATLPTGVRNTPTSISGLNTPFIEQSGFLTPSTGTGGAGTVYTETIPWTAPAAGTGSVKIFGCLNAVNATGNETGDKSQQATPLTITEAVAGPNAIQDISLASALHVYPTVTTDVVTVKANTLTDMTYEIYGINGAIYAKGIIAASGNTTVSMNGLAGGMYILRIADQDRTATYKLVKE